MIVQINPKEFVNDFVNPINDLNKEGKIAVFCCDGELYSISTKARAIYLYNTYKPLHISDVKDRFSLNVLKLVKGLQCIGSDEMFVSLELTDDSCNFSSKDIRFNIRLLDDNLVEVPKFNLDNFKKFIVHHTVEISSEKILNIRKALEFSNDTVKFYIEQEDQNVFLFFGDKNSTSNHSDNIKILIAENVDTSLPLKAYDVDILKLVLKSKNNFSIKLNDNGVMYIEIENSNSNLKYITTPLIK
jgi:hypothetical protein